MIPARLIVRAAREPWRDGVSLYGFGSAPGDHCFTVLQPARQLVEEGHQHDPFLTLNPTEAQVLMDSLWDCGLRPTEGAGSAGALLATQQHLEDMRCLVAQHTGAALVARAKGVR